MAFLKYAAWFIAATSAWAQTQPIKLSVDATGATRRLLHTTMQFPVKPGPFSLLYPKGVPSDQLNIQATLQVPNGWRYGTALPIESESGNRIVFKPSSLTTLV